MEVHKCIVNGCVNKSEDMIHYCLPEDPQRRQQWQVFIERGLNSGARMPDSSRICSEHFTQECFTHFNLGFTTRSILNVDAIPTIYEKVVSNVVSVESAEERWLVEKDRAGTATADGSEELTDLNLQLNHLSHSFNPLKEEPLHFNLHSEVNRFSESFHSTKEENGGEEDFAEGYDQIRVVEVDYTYPVKEEGAGEVYEIKEEEEVYAIKEEEEVYEIKEEEGEYPLPEEKLVKEYMKRAGLEESDKVEEGGMYIIEYSNPEEEEEQGGGKFALEFSYKGEEGGGEFVIEYHNEEEEEQEDEDGGGFDKLLYDHQLAVIKEEKKLQNKKIEKRRLDDQSPALKEEKKSQKKRRLDDQSPALKEEKKSEKKRKKKRRLDDQSPALKEEKKSHQKKQKKRRRVDDQSPVLMEEERIKKEREKRTIEEIWLEEKRLEERTNMVVERWKEERRVAEEEELVKHGSNEETERKKRVVGYHCHVCSEYFRNRGDFLDHQESHSVSVPKEPMPYRCDICPNTYFNTKKKLKYHLRDHQEGHKVKRTLTKKSFFCDICKTECRSQRMLDAHGHRHANQNVVFRCAFCPGEQNEWSGVRAKGNVLKHYNKEHPGMIPRCDLCQHNCRSIHNYLLHYARHRAVTAWYCKECKIYNRTERGLQVHLKNDGLRRMKEQRRQICGQLCNPEANTTPHCQQPKPDDPASPSETQLQDLQAPLPENSASSLESPTPKPDDPATRIIS